jgi:hypothetical protein
MNFVSVEAPAAGVAFAGEALELIDAALGVVSAGDGLQVVADQLVEALAKSFGFLAGAGDELVVEGQGDVHFLGLDTVYVDTGYVSRMPYLGDLVPICWAYPRTYEAVTKLVSSAEADSVCPTSDLPALAVPGFLMPPLRGWSGYCPTVTAWLWVS